MRRLMRIAVMSMVLVAGPSAAAEGCLSRGESRTAVEHGDAMPLSRIADRLVNRFGGQIVRADLCREGDGLAYRVTVLGGRGEVRTLIVDAGTGETLSQR